MPTFQFEAMDETGQEIRDVDRGRQPGRSPGHDPAEGLLRHQDRRQEEPRRRPAEKKAAQKKGKTFALGGVNQKTLTTFTRQLAILQDAGLPILRSLKILEQQSKPGA